MRKFYVLTVTAVYLVIECIGIKIDTMTFKIEKVKIICVLPNNKRLACVPYLWKIINFKIGFCWKIFSIVSAKIGLDNFCWARRNCSWFSRQLWQASQELNTYSIIWLLLLLTKVYKWWVGPTWLSQFLIHNLFLSKRPKIKNDIFIA